MNAQTQNDWSGQVKANAMQLTDEGEVADRAFKHSMSSQIGFLIRFAEAAVWNDLISAFKPLGCRPQQYAALKIISENQGCKQQELGEALGVSRSNLVMLVDELVGQGLIQRRQNQADRRSNALHLSPRGLVLLTELDKAQAAHEARINTVLDSDQQNQLATLLRQVAKLK